MVVALGPGRFYGSSLPRPRFYSDVKMSEDGKRVDPPLAVLDPLLSWAQEAHWSMGGLSFDRRRLQGRIEGSVKLLRVQEERKEREKKRKREERSVGSAVEGGSGRRRLRKVSVGSAVVPDVVKLPLMDEEAEVGSESEAVPEGAGDSPTPVPPPAPAVRLTRSGAAGRKLLRSSLLDDDSDGEGNARESVAATPLFPSAPKVVPPVAADEKVSGPSPRLKKKRARKLGEEFDRLAAADSPISSPAVPVAVSSSKRFEKKAPAKDKGKATDLTTPRKSPRVSPVRSFRRPRLLAV